MSRSWYAYNGVGEPLLPSSYNLSFSKPTCINGYNLCAIYGFGIGIHPSFLSFNMRTYITDGQLTLLAQPLSVNNVKKYVYMKL